MIQSALIGKSTTLTSKFRRIALLAILLTAAMATGAQAGLPGPICDQPALITCIGQSADAQMVRVLAERAKIQVKYDPVADGAAMSGNKTLILVLGGSSKGLGAAGIKPEQEEQRGKALVAAAKSAGAKIIVLHVGGEGRRGELSDPFIKTFAPSADFIIVQADGNKDKIFQQSAPQVPIESPETMADVGKFLKSAFK